MSLARTWAVAITGVDGHLIEVEADLSNQQPDFKIIGLADKALGEAVQRVHNACPRLHIMQTKKMISAREAIATSSGETHVRTTT